MLLSHKETVVLLTGVLFRLSLSVETNDDVFPAEVRANVSHVAVGAGALAAGAGLAWLQNYWQNRPTTQRPITVHRYPSPSYYYKPPVVNSPYFVKKPSSGGYYVRPQQHYYQPHKYQQYQQYPPHYQQQASQPHKYQQQYPPYYQHQQQQQQQQYPYPGQNYQSEFSSFNNNQPVHALSSASQGGNGTGPHQRKLSQIAAGGAGLAAGYYLLNKYNQYKDGQQNSQVVYRPSSTYYYSQPHYYYNPYVSHYPYYQGYHPAATSQSQHSRFLGEERVDKGHVLLGGLGLGAGATGYYLYNKFFQNQNDYSYTPSYTYRPSSSYHSYHLPHRVHHFHHSTSSRPYHLRENNNGDEPDTTCVPVYWFSAFGNHYYHCKGKFKFVKFPTNTEI